MKLPNGRALTGHSHDYKRHGTITLFAAFEVATGKVRGAHKKRRRKEFLDFMDEIVADYPKARLKVILDNLNTHKKNHEWLKRHTTCEATEQGEATPGGSRGGKGLTQGEQPLGDRGSDTEPKCRVDPNNGCASDDERL